MASEAGQRYRTTQGMVAGGLRQGILSGVLEGGRPLRQDEIAREFGVSRIPVREALRRLEGEGLVTFYPHRGATVSELSFEEATEIGEIRISLETLALRRALPNTTEEDLRRAEDVLDQADGEVTGAEYAQLNRRFHEVLYAPSRLHRLLAMLGPLHITFDRYIRVYYEVMKHRNLAQQEHRRILELCRGKDADAAAKELEQHIRNAIEDVLLYLEQEKGLKAKTSPDAAQI